VTRKEKQNTHVSYGRSAYQKSETDLHFIQCMLDRISWYRIQWFITFITKSCEPFFMFQTICLIFILIYIYIYIYIYIKQEVYRSLLPIITCSSNKMYVFHISLMPVYIPDCLNLCFDLYHPCILLMQLILVCSHTN
jgi:hypothetical protein